MAPTAALHVSLDAATATGAAATFIAARLTEAIDERGAARLALSGGGTGAALCDALARRPVPWPAVEVWQVDERVAPDGHPDRNATALVRALGPTGARLHLMDVTAPDLAAAARDYATALLAPTPGSPRSARLDIPGSPRSARLDIPGSPRSARLDVVHLGLGADGHTASWSPDEPRARAGLDPVAVTAPFNGYRRLTLTEAALAGATHVVWLVCGADKAGALARVLAHDPALPGSHALDDRSVIFADTAAAPR